MKVVIPGGTGFVGAVLRRQLMARGHEVVVLSRRGGDDPGVVAWDGRRLGDWACQLDGADVVINLAGRSVDCRYSEANLQEMMRSRVDSTRVVGEAIARANQPPRVWLQMSTATIYAHRFDAANDEATGILGGSEPDVPALWGRSIEIARAWEKTLFEADTPRTRRVAMRSAMVMSPGRGSVFDILLRLVRWGLGGPVAGGRQFMSWIHEDDFVRAVELLIDRDDISGAVNLAAPHPLPQRDFMAALRVAWGWRLGFPASRLMLEIGTFLLRTESELIVKSRRVVPGRLVAEGMEFQYPTWAEAAQDLVSRWRVAARKQPDVALVTGNSKSPATPVGV